MAKNILVVEDDSDITIYMRRFLESEGFRVDTVKNGALALEHLNKSETQPDGIVLDLMMPIMDGWEFRRRQLELEKLKSIPVIVLSASGGTKEGLGDAAILKKPVDLDVFLETIERIFV